MPSQRTTIIVTGCEASYYPLMRQCIDSMVALGLDQRADIGILDVGLTDAQTDELRALGCAVQRPEWPAQIPIALRVSHELVLAARPSMREYFPGYRLYISIDADAWVQTPEFFELLQAGAHQSGAAIVRENGHGYRRDYSYNRWWYGHLIAMYGPWLGLRVAWPAAVNIGVMALTDTAPHWTPWSREHLAMVQDRQRVNMDQHAFNACLLKYRLPAALLPARCDWICTLSTPVWDPQHKLVCEPGRGATPLSVLHLAGPNKLDPYRMRQTTGGALSSPLTYQAIKALREGAGDDRQNPVPASEYSTTAAMP
jgi:hypothetical protein